MTVANTLKLTCLLAWFLALGGCGEPEPVSDEAVFPRLEVGAEEYRLFLTPEASPQVWPTRTAAVEAVDALHLPRIHLAPVPFVSSQGEEPVGSGILFRVKEAAFNRLALERELASRGVEVLGAAGR